MTLQFWPDFSHGLSLQFQSVSVMDQPIQNGISQRPVTDAVMPFRNRQLAGDDSRTLVMSVIHNLQQVIALAVGLKPPVVRDQQVNFRQLLRSLL